MPFDIYQRVMSDLLGTPYRSIRKEMSQVPYLELSVL